MGEVNSSVTRVWPVFDTLLAQDETGDKWLAQLFALAPMFPNCEVGSLLPGLGKFNREFPRNLRKVIGEGRIYRLGNLRSCFEVDYPPPRLFLRWLIENAASLRWPRDNHGNPRVFSPSTQSKRISLREPDHASLAEALGGLEDRKAEGSRRKWWAFEGFTSVDCALETDQLLVFVEGKRTEPISSATDWYPLRNQVIRNLEVASYAAEKARKNFGVLLCAETPVRLEETAFTNGLPHLSQPQRDALRTHYWGCITWRQIVDVLCLTLKLPDNLEDAVQICERLRPVDQQ